MPVPVQLIKLVYLFLKKIVLNNSLFEYMICICLGSAMRILNVFVFFLVLQGIVVALNPSILLAYSHIEITLFGFNPLNLTFLKFAVPLTVFFSYAANYLIGIGYHIGMRSLYKKSLVALQSAVHEELYREKIAFLSIFMSSVRGFVIFSEIILISVFILLVYIFVDPLLFFVVLLGALLFLAMQFAMDKARGDKERSESDLLNELKHVASNSPETYEAKFMRLAVLRSDNVYQKGMKAIDGRFVMGVSFALLIACLVWLPTSTSVDPFISLFVAVSLRYLVQFSREGGAQVGNVLRLRKHSNLLRQVTASSSS